MTDRNEAAPPRRLHPKITRMLRESIRRYVKQYRASIIAYHILNNYIVKLRSLLRIHRHPSGSTHRNLSIGESLDYINSVYDDYFLYSGLSERQLPGLRILEIGPGDNFGVALKFLTAGAESIVCLDKFYSERDEPQQVNIYRSFREKLTARQRRIFDQTLAMDAGLSFNQDRLKYVYGVGIEQAVRMFDPKSFDLIVSRAVLEHVSEMDQAIDAMGQLLVPGGRMIHKIDFRDHGMFSSDGLHPLTFLTVPKFVYRMMGSGSGKPNRKLRQYYDGKMKELGYDYEIFITKIVGETNELIPHEIQGKLGTNHITSNLAQVESIRNRLTGEFRQLADEDLLISGIFLTAQKPA